MTIRQNIKVFISYSHKDEILKDELLKHLSILKRKGIVLIWNDRDMIPGDELDSEIIEHLNTSTIILLLISPDFMASDYCFDVEMASAIKRHKCGLARVIPIILRKTDDWNSLPIGKLLALPKDGKPVTSWLDRDEAFADITRGIRETIDNLGLFETITNTVHENKPEDWQSYYNSRFGFSIKVPINWTIGLESDNGDGVELYIGNPEIDIRAYASFYLKDISSPYDKIGQPGYRGQRLRLINELEAELIIGKFPDKITYEMIQIIRNIEYHFYAHVPLEFFNKNEQVLLSIVKNFNALLNGIEKD